jgi:uncharacterized membrane protein YhaH (DUF805 family)
MAIVEQCNKCRRSLSECPYYNKDDVGFCENYVKPIDNSRFFSHFFSPKGRIGRLQYLVTVLIVVALYALVCYLLRFFLSADEIRNSAIPSICFIPSAALVIVAGLKRCHDAGVDWWYAIIPIVLLFVFGLVELVIGAAAFFFLFFQKGEDGLNEYGSEPLKPYLPQIE